MKIVHRQSRDVYHHHETESEHDQSSGIFIPSYALYLLGFAMFLMFLVIVYLIYILHKKIAKGVTYQPFSRQESAISRNGGYNRQASNDKPPLIRTPTVPVIQYDSLTLERNPLNQISARNSNEKPNVGSTLSVTQFNKINPLLNSHLHPNSILPDQMKKICMEALEKKLTLKEIDEIQRRQSQNGNLAREKSLSTSALDVYDTLPYPTPANELKEAMVLDDMTPAVEKEIEIEENKKHNEEKSSAKLGTDLDKSKDVGSINSDGHKPTKDNIIEDTCDDIPLYDSPPTATWKTNVLEDNGYLSPISTSECPHKLEPSYINAKKTDFIL